MKSHHVLLYFIKIGIISASCTPNFVQFARIGEVKSRPRHPSSHTDPASHLAPVVFPENTSSVARDTERRGNSVPRAALNLPPEVSAGASGTQAGGTSPPGFCSPPLPLSRARRFQRGEVQTERGRCTSGGCTVYLGNYSVDFHELWRAHHALSR